MVPTEGAKKFRQLGIEIMGEGRPTKPSEHVPEYEGLPKYKNKEQAKAQVELFHTKIVTNKPMLGMYDIKNKLFEAINKGLDLAKINADDFIAFLDRIIDMNKHLSWEKRAPILNSAIDDFLYSAHPVAKERDIVIEINNFKNKFIKSRSKIFESPYAPGLTIKEPKSIKPTQYLSHQIAALQKAQIDTMIALIKKAGIKAKAYAANGKTGKYKEVVTAIKDLLEEYGIFQTAVNRNKSAGGQILKASDIGEGANKEILDQKIKRSKKGEHHFIDRHKVAKIIGNPDHTTLQKIDRLVEATLRGDLDLKAVLRNGIVHVESTGQKSVVRKAADVLDWLSNTLVMNLVSGIGTAYDILEGSLLDVAISSPILLSRVTRGDSLPVCILQSSSFPPANWKGISSTG